MKALEIISLVLELVCSVLSIVAISMVLKNRKVSGRPFAPAIGNLQIIDSLH